MSELTLVPMTAAYAADILTWRYPPPYDRYDLAGGDPAYYLDPASPFFAVLCDGELVAFRSFGPDGQVPGGDYRAAALDTGGGLRPELTGQGLGRPVIAAGLAFGRERFAPPAFRVTVASFNTRALRVVTSLGFVPVSEFTPAAGGSPFTILLLAFSSSLAPLVVSTARR